MWFFLSPGKHTHEIRHRLPGPHCGRLVFYLRRYHYHHDKGDPQPGQTGYAGHPVFYACIAQAVITVHAVIQKAPVCPNEKTAQDLAAPKPLALHRSAGPQGYQPVLAGINRHTQRRAGTTRVHDYPVITPSQFPAHSPVVTTLSRQTIPVPRAEQASQPCRTVRFAA